MAVSVGSEEWFSYGSFLRHKCSGIFVKISQACNDVVYFVVFSPLLRLSPPPSDRDYYFNLDDNEGVADLFDIVNYPV